MLLRNMNSSNKKNRKLNKIIMLKMSIKMSLKTHQCKQQRTQLNWVMSEWLLQSGQGEKILITSSCSLTQSSLQISSSHRNLNGQSFRQKLQTRSINLPRSQIQLSRIPDPRGSGNPHASTPQTFPWTRLRPPPIDGKVPKSSPHSQACPLLTPTLVEARTKENRKLKIKKIWRTQHW